MFLVHSSLSEGGPHFLTLGGLERPAPAGAGYEVPWPLLLSLTCSRTIVEMVATLWSQPTMPGIYFQRLRAELSVAEVLEVLGFVATQGSGHTRYGPCPPHPLSAKEPDA